MTALQLEIPRLDLVDRGEDLRWWLCYDNKRVEDLGFDNKKRAREWIYTLIREDLIDWRQGYSVVLRDDALKLAVLDQHGNTPKG